MDIDVFEAKIREFVSAGLAELILSNIEPCLRLIVAPTPDASIPVGATKLGGHADVPPGFEWPMWTPPHRRSVRGAVYETPSKTSLPLSFIAQVNLADAAAAGMPPELPNHGLLTFFADPPHYSGLYASDRKGFMVTWFPQVEVVERTSTPARGRTYDAGVARLELAPSLPYDEILDPEWDESPASDQRLDELSELEFDLLQRVLDQLLGTRSRHQLLGYDNYEHSPAPGWVPAAASTRHGPEGSANLDERSTRREADKWQLLLQVDSDESLNMMWMDVGKLYFCIDGSRPSVDSFDQVWLTIQG